MRRRIEPLTFRWPLQICVHAAECGAVAHFCLVVDGRRRKGRRHEYPLCPEHARHYAEKYGMAMPGEEVRHADL